MIAVFVNAIAVAVGSIIGILLRGKLKESILKALTVGIALCTAVIGIKSAVGTNDLLCLVICIVVGVAVGELLHIESGIEKLGSAVKGKLFHGKSGNNGFSEGLVSASLLFCVGSMAIMGSLEAGINHNYSIIFTKSVLDFISSLAFAAAMGFGVLFSAVSVFVFQGSLTLVATFVGRYLQESVVTEMSAVGGLILIGMAINMLELRKEKIKVANMLPAVFLPIAYIPLVNFLTGLFS